MMLKQGISQDQRRMYSDLAWTWPMISRPEHYVEEAEHFLRIIHYHTQIDVKTLLDLGCGGGHNDWTLKKHVQVTGVDVSDDMLTLARRLNPEVTYLAGDMRTVRLGRTFDAVIIADSIDYMLSEQDLYGAFVTAFVHLKPGGVFCTYVEMNRDNWGQNKTECTTHVQDDVEIVFVDNRYDPDPADTLYENVFVYLIRRSGELSIEMDHHLGGIFDLQV
jgi:SAM-dependent methyltransferase